MNSLLLAIAMFAQVQTRDAHGALYPWVADRWEILEVGKNGDWLIAVASKDYPETVVRKGVVSLGVTKGEVRTIVLGTAGRPTFDTAKNPRYGIKYYRDIDEPYRIARAAKAARANHYAVAPPRMRGRR